MAILIFFAFIIYFLFAGLGAVGEAANQKVEEQKKEEERKQEREKIHLQGIEEDKKTEQEILRTVRIQENNEHVKQEKEKEVLESYSFKNRIYCRLTRNSIVVTEKVNLPCSKTQVELYRNIKQFPGTFVEYNNDYVYIENEIKNIDNIISNIIKTYRGKIINKDHKFYHFMLSILYNHLTKNIMFSVPCYHTSFVCEGKCKVNLNYRYYWYQQKEFITDYDVKEHKLSEEAYEEFNRKKVPYIRSSVDNTLINPEQFIDSIKIYISNFDEFERELSKQIEEHNNNISNNNSFNFIELDKELRTAIPDKRVFVNNYYIDNDIPYCQFDGGYHRIVNGHVACDADSIYGFSEMNINDAQNITVNIRGAHKKLGPCSRCFR